MSLFWILWLPVCVYSNLVTVLFEQLLALMSYIFVVQGWRRYAVLTCLSSSHCPSLGLLTTSSKHLIGVRKEFLNLRKPILYCVLPTTGSGYCKSNTRITVSFSPTTQIGGERNCLIIHVHSDVSLTYNHTKLRQASGWSFWLLIWYGNVFADTSIASDTAFALSIWSKNMPNSTYSGYMGCVEALF